MKKGAISVGVALVAALAAIGAGQLPFVQTVELKTYDWRMRQTARPSAPAEDIVLVSINDDSIRRMAPLVGRWPWPRLVHADVIDYLAAAPARLIVYDILFTERDVTDFSIGSVKWTGAESDAEFVKSVAKAGNVIVAGDVAAEQLQDISRAVAEADEQRPRREIADPGPCVEVQSVFVQPFADLDRAAKAVGHTMMKRDLDGPVRRHYPFVRVGEKIVPSLPAAAALALGFQPNSGPACPPLVAYRGPTLGPQKELTFNEHSFYTLFKSQQERIENQMPELDPGVFKDKIVIVSATASGTYEVQVTPFAQGIVGGEVHANVIDSFLRRRTIEELETWPKIAKPVAVAVLLGLVGAFVTVWPLAAAAVTLAGLVVFVSVRYFAAGIWMPLVTPLLAIGLTFVGELAWQYFVEGREKRQVKKLFSRYVPKDVYEQLMSDPTRAALGGKRRVMTVLFSDVRGFTAMSEKSTPEEVVGQLNEYFSRMVDVLFEHQGTLDKFVGDMVMGLFGAPLEDPDHADHAVQTAVAMSHALNELNRKWAAEGRPQLDIGVGISTGDMVAGNIGSSAIMSYTVIGDTVNLGARLESLNKEYGTRIIISEVTKEALKGRYDIHPLGGVTVKGKSKPVQIFEVKPV